MPSHGDVFKDGDSHTASPIARPYLLPKISAVPLHGSCTNGDSKLLETLIKQGGDVDEVATDGSTPLTLAAYHGHSRCVKILLASGAKCNARDENGNQAIHIAVKRNHRKSVAYLIEYGADVNTYAASGLCPIHTAAKYDYTKILQLLLDNNVKIDKYTKTDNPQHALHLAAARGNAAALKLLLNYTDYTEPRDNQGRTPLYLGTLKGHTQIVLALVIAKADVNAADISGKIPLEIAIDSGLDDISYMLCEHGGDVSLRYFRSPRKEDTTPANIDRYGVIKPDSYEFDLLGDITKIGHQARSLQVESGRVRQWERMIKHWHRYMQFKPDKVRKRIARGIPDCVRGQVWKLLSKLTHPVDQSEYKKLRSEPSHWAHQIDLDVSRAFRNHLMYRTRYGKGQCSLFGLLKSYSIYDPVLGYCQGMGDVAALLLKYIPEREAFSVIDILMKDSKWGMRGCFITGFPKLQKTFFVHDKLLNSISPRLYEHLKKEGAGTPLYSTRWYLTAFLDIFSFEITLRLWDLFFLDGYDVLFSIAMAILKMFEEELLTMKFDKLMQFVHTLGQRLIDTEEFLMFITEHRISSRSIRRYEKMYESGDKEYLTDME